MCLANAAPLELACDSRAAAASSAGDTSWQVAGAAGALVLLLPVQEPAASAAGLVSQTLSLMPAVEGALSAINGNHLGV